MWVPTAFHRPAAASPSTSPCTARCARAGSPEAPIAAATPATAEIHGRRGLGIFGAKRRRAYTATVTSGGIQRCMRESLPHLREMQKGVYARPVPSVHAPREPSEADRRRAEIAQRVARREMIDSVITAIGVARRNGVPPVEIASGIAEAAAKIVADPIAAEAQTIAAKLQALADAIRAGVG